MNPVRVRGRPIQRALAVAWWSATVCVPIVAHAAPPPCVIVPASSARRWDEPLDRVISLNARDVALRAALDQLSAAARTAFAYSPDLVALDRRVCLVADERPLGDLLAALLAGTGIAPTVVAGRVVLGPQPTGPAPAPATRGGGVDVLERVVVTGNAVATVRRPLTMAVEIVDGDRLRRQSLTSLATLMNAAAPGAWMWAPSPGTLLAQYSGLRGTSSFGSSAPKIYVDGIEAANPLLVTRLDPDAIDHVEIIRGPQGSALYGTDAISGVVHIITRHEGTAPSGDRFTVSSTAGTTSSAYHAGLVPTHEERAVMRAGTNLRSAAVAAQVAQTGAIYPGGSTRDLALSGNARAVGSAATWSGTARFLDRRAGAGQNPLLRGLAPARPADSLASVGSKAPGTAPQVAREYTLATSAAVATAGAFTHSVHAGIDGYRLDHVVTAGSLYPVPADSALRATQGSGDRTTLRVSTVGRFPGDASWPATTLAIGLEQSVLRQAALVSTVSAPAAGVRYPAARDAQVQQWNHDVGLFSQLSAAWSDAYFLSAGLRVERNDAFTGRHRRPLLPMIGAAAVRDIGPASLKIRTAYGKGIRPPSSPARGTMAQEGFGIATSGSLDPEAQSGTEAGMELYVGSTASLQLTRFDQVASGLVQNVLVGVDTQMRAGRVVRHLRYQLQNVGEIGNHGWELQGSVTRGAASLTSALTRVESRVRSVSGSYGGDLRVGDAMLGVPDRTATATVAWAPAAWSAAVSVTRASRWINYDRLALARDYAAASSPAHDIGGARLRGYWKTYEGDTHLRATVTRALRGTLELLAVGDNLLGGQLGEPDNVTIRAGRMVTAGLRAGF